MPLLSILISAIPSRWEMARKLFEGLTRVADQRVEVLLLFDNKRRSVGEKRQALLDIARGEYVTFIDDDDLVAPGYVSEILSVITECASK